MLGSAAQFLIIGALIASAWVYGCVEAAHQVLLVRCISLASVFVLFTAFFARGMRSAVPALAVPLVLAVGLAGLQLIPSTSVGTFAPQVAQVRAEFDGTDSNAPGPLSLSPADTRHDLALLTMHMLAFLLASFLFQTPQSQRILCMCLAVNGACLAVWGIVQQATRPDELLPGVARPENSIIFSTWVNHSSAAGYLNLCLGAAVGLTLHSLRDTVARSVETTWTQRLARCITPHSLLFGSLSVVIFAGVLASLSRGGLLSTLVGVFVVACVMARSRWRSGVPALAVLVVLALCVTAWVGLSDVTAGRYGSLSEGAVFRDGRWPHWNDGLSAARRFAPLGSGLGTYRYVYLLDERNPRGLWFQHAHNQYIETLVDAGLPGFVLLLAAIGMVAIAIRAVLSNRNNVGHYWFAIAATFALVTQVTHALTDFGLYMPANALCFAVICGAICGTAASGSTGGCLIRLPYWLSRPQPWLLAGFLLTLLSSREIQARATSARCQTLTEARETLEDIEAGLRICESTLKLIPQDVPTHLRAARLRLRRFQLQALAAFHESTDHEVAADAEERVSLQAMHAELMRHSETDREARRNDLLAQSIVGENLPAAADHLRSVRDHSIFLPSVHLQLGLLAPLVGEDDLPHLRRASMLSRSDEDLNYGIGMLHYQASRYDAMLESWQRSLELSHDKLVNALTLSLTCVDGPTVAKKLFSSDPHRLFETLERLPDVGSPEFRSAFVARVRAALESASDIKAPQRHYLLSQVAKRASDDAGAANHLREAVEARPNQLQWRFECAAALQKLGEYSEAGEHARWCVRLNPQKREYRRLLDEIDQALASASRK